MNAHRTRMPLLLICLALSRLFVAVAEPKPAPKTVVPDLAQAGADTAPEQPFREQSIYVPYRKLHEVFEKPGRGVFLPYEEFLRLWEAAREHTAPTPASEPPVDYVISEFHAEATVAGDTVAVTATVRIELLKPGWHQVRLHLSDAAVTAATLSGQPAQLLATPEAGHVLLAYSEAKETKPLELHLAFSRAYEKAPGRNSVSFACPPAPVSRWDIHIPEEGVQIEIQPLIAATQIPPAEGVRSSRLLAFVGAAPTVRIQWTPRAEGATGLAALASVQAEHEVRIEAGVIRNKVSFDYAISRAELAQIEVEVPVGERIVNVFDPNVRKWAVHEQDGAQRIIAELFEPAKQAQRLVIELERHAAQDTVAVPVMRALGVSRQQGLVVVNVSEGMRAEAIRREGLLQLDADELPARIRQGTWDFAYRYAALPFELALRVDTVQPRILADTLLEVQLEPESLTLDALVAYDVQRTGVFQFQLRVPAGYEVQYIRGHAFEKIPAAEIDSHHPAESDSELTVVNLSRQARGPVGLAMRLVRPLTEPDLLAPTGKAAVLEVPIPRLDPRTVTRETGRLVVYSPEALRVNALETAGLREISRTEALKVLGSPQNRPGRAVLSFAYGDDPVALRLEAERRRPHITVAQLLTARIESGVVRFNVTLHCDVRYSGIKALRLDLPEAVASQARVLHATVRQSRFTESEAVPDLAPGYVAWRLAGPTELIGRHQIPIVWEQKLEELDAGRSVAIELPRLIPHGTDRAWGQIVLAKAESIDIIPTDVRSGLRAIDPQTDLVQGTSVKDAALAFEFHDAWNLTVTATRYETKDVKTTSIERGLVRMVLTRSDVTSVQAVYRMRSARQRLAIRLPDGVQFDTQPLRLNGRPVPLEQGDGGEFFVPLVQLRQDDAFLLEVRYVLRDAGRRLLVPQFPNEPATQRVLLSVFLPREWAFLGKLGPWTDEFVWVFTGATSWPRARHNNDWLVNWVAEGATGGQQELAGFTTDGRHVLFSALRPEADKHGALRLFAVRRAWLDALVLLLGVGIGLALIPARAARRLLVCGVVAIGLLILAVFCPSLVRALITNATMSGAVVVLLVWTLKYLLITRPRECQARTAGNNGTAEPPAPTPEPPALSRTATKETSGPGTQPPSPDSPALDRAEDDQGGKADA